MSTGENTVKKNRANKKNRSSTVNTFIVMMCTLISRLLGFVRNALIASLFGAGGEASILHLTFAVPNNLRKLMAEGALSSAFIPEISTSLVKEKNNGKAKFLTSLLIGFQLIVLIPLSLVSIIYAEPLIKYVLSELRNPEEITLAVSLFRWFIFYIVLISVNATIMAVLNSHSEFLIPALTPVLFSVAVISSLVLLYRHLGVYAMAVGVLSGGVVQILFQLPVFLRSGYSIIPAFRFNEPGFLRVMKRWGPVVLSSSVFSIIQIVAIRFASGIDDAGVAGLQNAIIFWQLPMGIFSASVSTVMFPRMSRLTAEGKEKDLSNTIAQGIELLLVLLLPSMLVLVFLGHEIISVAYQRYRFTAQDTAYTVRIMTAYSYGLFSVGAYNFMQRYHFSRDRFKTVTATAIVIAVVDISLSLFWKETTMGVSGLALANTAAFTIGFLMLYLPMIISRGKSIVIKNMITLLKLLPALLPGALVLYFHHFLFGDWWVSGSSVINLLRLLAVSVSFSVLTLIMYRLTRIDSVNILLRRRRKG